MNAMNKILRKFIYISGFAVALFATGCADDIDPEITELKVSRLFSPVDLEARIVNQTSVRLTWKPVNKAKSYTMEFYEGNMVFQGNPVKTITGITFDKVPYTVPGFAGETRYSVQVKAVGEEISDSKWVQATFITDPEQIFYAVNPEEITATGVTLRWPAGETATSIVFTPGNITRPVTSAEIAAGVAVITGLNSETAYTAKLMNGNSTRGTVTFTTLIDLGGATPVHPGDDLSAMIAAATAGEVLVLFPGNYTVVQGDITINKSITIKGLYPHNMPVIYNRFVLESGVQNFTVMNLEMVGMYGEPATRLAQAFFLNPGTYNINSVNIEGCVIREYNQALIYGGNAVARIQDLKIHNNIISNIFNDGGDFIDFRTGYVANLTITNSTFNRVAAAPRDFIRLDNSAGNFPGSTSSVVIDKCTFYNVSNGRRILYVRFVNNTSTVSNTIFAGAESTYGGYYSNQTATTQPVCSKNNYHNAPLFISGTITNGKYDISGTHTTLDPGFVNPAAGNFRVTNENLKINGIGDPRWLN